MADRHKASDNTRSRTRVNIGSAIQRWRELKERKAFRAHTTGFLAGFCCRRQISTVCDKTPGS
uniref:Uncharacterized protein n=1 Tax=Sinocyclocheilus rhinocerous TaxID=307959 RepID=A0A673H8I7_9TELE